MFRACAFRCVNNRRCRPGRSATAVGSGLTEDVSDSQPANLAIICRDVRGRSVKINGRARILRSQVHLGRTYDASIGTVAFNPFVEIPTVRGCQLFDRSEDDRGVTHLNTDIIGVRHRDFMYADCSQRGAARGAHGAQSGNG